MDWPVVLQGAGFILALCGFIFGASLQLQKHREDKKEENFAKKIDYAEATFDTGLGLIDRHEKALDRCEKKCEKLERALDEERAVTRQQWMEISGLKTKVADLEAQVRRVSRRSDFDGGEM
jgi:chromosome segregation ATPase